MTTATARRETTRRSAVPLVAICLGYFMVILDTMVVNVALPSLGRDLRTGVSGLQWVVAGYTLVFAGLALGAAGLVGWLAGGPHTPYYVLVAPLLATGFGMALTMPAATAAVMGSAPAERAGLASGVINTARQVGGAIGVALLGTLVAHRETFTLGLRVSMVIAAAAFGVGCALTVTVIRGEAAERRLWVTAHLFGCRNEHIPL